MILNKITPYNGRLEHRCRYAVRAGAGGEFQRECRAMWDYLRQACQGCVSLTIFPFEAKVDWKLADLMQAAPAERVSADATVVLHTSGTTGAPKPVSHLLGHVIERKRVGAPGGKWLLTFAPFRWAGVSVLLHVLKADAQVVIPHSLNPLDLVASAVENQVTHVSMTPSLFRKLQLASSPAELSQIPLQQISFGGEAATQSVLDMAQRLWQHARISHVYASTEFGDICSVSDGKAGIPEDRLSGTRYAFTSDGELQIEGKGTGDLWALRNGRHHFLGRREEVINVGGAKVSPLEVEEAARLVQGVSEVRAYPVANPLLGQVVGMDYCGSLGEADLRCALRQRLRKVAMPLVLRKLSELELTPAGKTGRVGVRV